MRINIFLFSILLAFQGTAQITVSNATFPAVGDTLRYQTDSNPPVLNLGTVGGSNQIWDFTGLQGTQIQTRAYLDAASGTGFSNFPNAGLRTGGPLTETYLRKTTTVFEVLGTTGADQLNLGLNTTVRYQPPLPERRAPMHFFDINNFETDLNYALPTGALADSLLGQLGTLVDSFRIRIHTKRLDVVDAWGTCSIPGGTFPVLREKRTETTETAIDVHTFLGWVDLSSLLGGGGSSLLGQIGKDTTLMFHFFSATEKEEIAVLTLDNSGSVVTSAQFKFIPTITAIADLTAPRPSISLAPNPASKSTEVQFKNFPPGGSFLLKINDLQGRLLSQQVFSNADTGLSIDLGRLPASGLFIIQIFNENGALLAAEKLLKQP